MPSISDLPSTEHLFLIGYMASGKSTVGAHLGRLLHRSFRDLDQDIEQRVGMSIPEIIAEQGLEGFRELERAELLQLSDVAERCIVATGGGTACSKENLSVMHQLGRTVFLRVPEPVLLQRLREDSSVRPLLPREDADLEGFIRHHLAERLNYYKTADFTVCGVGQPKEVADRIAEVITAALPYS